MAKIKDIQLEVSGVLDTFRIRCSSKGVFSCKLPYRVSRLLGLPQELTGLSLKEVEDRLMGAYSSYRNSETKYSLKIAIDFTANGAFVATDDLDMQHLFIRNGFSTRFHKTVVPGSFPHSELRFGFMTVIEEDINGQLTYYKAVKQRSDFEAEGSVVVDGYIKHSVECIRGCTLIPYSDEVISRLEEIEAQFRKASYFLAGSLSAEDVPAAICSGTLLLTQ